MRLIQVIDTHGVLAPGLVRDDRAIIRPPNEGSFASTLDLLLSAVQDELDISGWFDVALEQGDAEEVSWSDLASDGHSGPFRLTVPIVPPEVWGCGVTYRRSADFREEGLGIYDRIYEADRPELFFKASPSRTVGPFAPIGRRRDSAFTAAEPELALVVSHDGAILGYTLANDVSAWDIERDNPLYLPQSKIYTGCFSCGPVIVTPDEVPDEYGLTLTCAILRGGHEVFRGEASTRQLKRTFPELVSWLLRSNDVPTGTVLSTGTGIIQPIEVGLEPGDIVTIACPEIGILSNPVAMV
jgi:2-dehydro-3-deoxy-D-arabinonate dehydratase